MITIDDLRHHCTEEGDCLLWKRGCCNGHPAIRVETKTKLVRRVLWESANGPIPDGKILRATCDNVRCIEPTHTELTTYKRVAKECGALGLMSGPVRSAAIQRVKRNGPQCKLSVDAVRAIRASDENIIVLAARYGVSQAHISKVRKHKCQIDYQSPFAGLGARL